jgi:WD40 repeat protein
MVSHSSANWVASAHENGSISVTDFQANRIVQNLNGAHSDAVSCLAFSPINTMQLVTGGHDGAVKTWDVRKLSSESETALISSVENAH